MYCMCTIYGEVSGAVPRDADKSALASKSAFENDIHFGAPNPDGGGAGPPGYRSPEWQRRMMRVGRYCKVLVDAQIVGQDECYGCGVCVVKCPSDSLTLKLVRSEEHLPV